VTRELAFEGVIEEPDVVECVCECADPDCTARLRVTRRDYELARSSPATFIVARGHELREIERIVFEDGDFSIVEKHPGERAVAAEVEPRS
jgi:hypothetical protein